MAEVLVVGAGPTGLALACDLAWRGVGVRVVDARAEPSRYSRAIGVFPRTLELLENAGVADELVRKGVRVRGINIHSGVRRLATIATGRIASHYDYVLVVEQSVTEGVLIERLASLGVRVERPVKLVELRQARDDPDGVRVVLERPGAGREAASVPWVVGCDGSRSFVREALVIPFEGERYGEAFDLADVEVRWKLPGARDHLNVFLSKRGVVFVAPLPGGGYRLISDEPPGSADEERPSPTLDDFRTWWRERVGYPPAREAELSDPSWLSRFTIQRRMVPEARRGRVLLAGDATHVHSPAGAQGMNGGIQDAVNLGWKLALVAQGRAPEGLLDTYGEERLPVARGVLKATHLGTTVMTTRNPLVAALRNGAIGALMRSGTVQKRAVNTAAELRVGYRRSPMSSGGGRDRLGVAVRALASPSGAPIAGDRAPDVALGGSDEDRLYDHLGHPGHTLLAFAGEHPTAEALRRAAGAVDGLEERYGALVRGCVVATGRGVTPVLGHEGRVLLDPAGAAHARYAMREGGLCLIRPDRYVASRAEAFDPERLCGYLDRWTLPGRTQEAKARA